MLSLVLITNKKTKGWVQTLFQVQDKWLVPNLLLALDRFPILSHPSWIEPGKSDIPEAVSHQYKPINRKAIKNEPGTPATKLDPWYWMLN